MLPKKERLTQKEFSRFFSLGEKTHSPHLQVVFHPYPTFHCAVAVSKKVHKTAVKRNKLRRQIYDMVRRYRSSKEARGVYIIIPKPNIISISREEIQDELKTIFEKLNT